MDANDCRRFGGSRGPGGSGKEIGSGHMHPGNTGNQSVIISLPVIG